MDIKYGEHNHKTVFYDGKPTPFDYYTIRDVVGSDQEELAHFIKLQQEHKGSRNFTFERKVTDKGTRYIIKTWMEWYGTWWNRDILLLRQR